MKYTYILPIVVCLLCLSEQAYPNMGIQPSKPAVFRGNVFKKSDSSNVYLEFSLSSNSRSPEKSIGSVTERISLAHEGNFVFTTPTLLRPEKLSYLVVGIDQKRYGFFNFVVEPGDSINMNVTIESGKPLIYFSGKGSSKYNCRYAAEQTIRSRDSLISEMAIGMGKWENWTTPDLQKAVEIYLHGKDELRLLLRKYQPYINEDIFKVMLADMNASDINAAQFIWNLKSKASKIPRSSVQQALETILDTTSPVTEKLSYLVPDYVDYLANIIALRLYMKNDSIPAFEEIYEACKGTFDGEIRDRIFYVLLTGLAPRFSLKSLFHQLSPSDKHRILSDAAATIGSSEVKEQILALDNAHRKGAAAYPFCLPDTASKKVCLEDFRGKIVVLDLWFTGCGGCARLATAMKKYIKPNFVGKDVVFVSISTDKEKEMWMNSVRSEIYSEREDVNLYTGGSGFQHEIIKHYGLVGLPFLLVVDRSGNIVSAPPASNRYFQKITNMINEALETK